MTSIRTILAAASMMAIGLVACSSSSDSSQTPVDPRIQVAGYDPGPLADGFTRFVTPVIKGIEPGADKMWCQYLTTPYATETDIADLRGSQSKGGHHIVFYAVKYDGGVGTTRDCNDNDMSRAVFLGGIGGEGASAIGRTLPEGTVFRIPKGYSLMANVHFINSTPKTYDGQGVIDLKLTQPDPAKKPATLFVNVATDSKLLIPPHEGYKLDLNCSIKGDIELYMFGNHMHQYGTMAYSEIIRGDASREMLKQDLTWSPNDAFNPNFNVWTAAAPMKFKNGDVVHTHCEWNNTSDQEIRFPTEMCVGFGLFLGHAEVDCIDGEWTGGDN